MIFKFLPKFLNRFLCQNSIPRFPVILTRNFSYGFVPHFGCKDFPLIKEGYQGGILRGSPGGEEEPPWDLYLKSNSNCYKLLI